MSHLRWYCSEASGEIWVIDAPIDRPDDGLSKTILNFVIDIKKTRISRCFPQGKWKKLPKQLDFGLRSETWYQAKKYQT